MRYVIDFTEGGVPSRDEEGLDFADLNTASLSATEALAEIARDALRLGPRASACTEPAGLHLGAQVRDESGHVAFRVRLDLDVEWPPG